MRRCANCRAPSIKSTRRSNSARKPPACIFDLGELYARAQQWDKAEEQFRLEAELPPGSALAAYRLGESLLQLGKFHEARAALVRSNELKADMPETLYQLGKASSLDGDDAAAQKYWRTSPAAGIRYGAGGASAFRAGNDLSQGRKNPGSRTRDGAIPEIAKQARPKRTIRRSRRKTETAHDYDKAECNELAATKSARRCALIILAISFADRSAGQIGG